MRWLRILALAATGAGFLTTTGTAQDEGITVGSRAPVVSVPDLDGRPVDLGRFIGKQPVFLEFWATWCPICEDLLPRVRAARARYGDRVAFIGVNVAVNQTRDRVRRYLRQHDVPFQVVYDEEGVSTRAFDAPQTSYIVIVDREGKVVYTGVGTEQKFEDALARVTARP
jgi:thiol-disulfide isomerase/thioredoxin